MDYNTSGKPKTLLGNWTEERYLEEKTGVARLADVGDKNLDTKGRVVPPTYDSFKGFKSTQRKVHNYTRYEHDYKMRTKGLRLQQFMEREERKAAEQIKQAEEDDERRRRNRRYLTAESRAQFPQYGRDEYAKPKGRRVMKTQDGRELPANCRDTEFLAKAGLSKQRSALTDQEVADTLDAAAERVAAHAGTTLVGVIPGEERNPGDTLARSVTRRGKVTGALEAPAYVRDQPVTIYSQRLAEQCFAGSAAGPANPFARNSLFTNELPDQRQHHGGAEDYGDNSVTAVPPAAAAAAGGELGVSDILARLRARLLDAKGPSALAHLAHDLRQADTSGDGAISQRELEAVLRHNGVTVTPREAMAALAMLDADGSGRVSVAELVAGFVGVAGSAAGVATRRTLTLRTSLGRSGTPMGSMLPASRMQVVREAFASVDTAGRGGVRVNAVAAAMDPTAHPGVRAGKITAEKAALEVLRELDSSIAERGGREGRAEEEDFISYHELLSAGISSDDEFVRVVSSLWRIPTDVISRAEIARRTSRRAGTSGRASAGAGAGGVSGISVAGEEEEEEAGVTGGGRGGAGTRKVLVRFHNGSEDVMRVADKVGGLTKIDEPAIRARLRSDGIKNIHSVQLLVG